MTGHPEFSSLPAYELKPPTAEQARSLGEAFAKIDPWLRYGFTPEAIAGFLCNDESGAPRFAIFRDGTLAGAIILRTVWLRGPYLQFLAILPAHQNTGLGSAMLAWLEEIACTAGDRNIWLVTSEFNSGARRFYERHGFAYVATLDDLIADGLTEILLRKKL